MQSPASPMILKSVNRFCLSIRNQTFAYRHRNSTTILTVELVAILQCLVKILLTLPPLILILSYHRQLSIRSVSHFQRTFLPPSSHTHPHSPPHSIFHHFFRYLHLGLHVASHSGVQLNKAVDTVAKASTNFPLIIHNFLPTKSDLTLFIPNSIIKHWWINLWQKQPPTNKLAQIKFIPFPRPSSPQTHLRHEIFLTRLCIGYTRITQTYLPSNLFPLSCDHCNLDSPLTCPAFATLRLTLHVLHSKHLFRITPRLFQIYFPTSKPLILFLASNPTILTAKLIARVSLKACKNFFLKCIWNFWKSVSIVIIRIVEVGNENVLEFCHSFILI